jgi:DNA (cytosine-5)-methyltransferase 1
VDLIPEARALAEESGLPYVIENVPGAPLISPVKLCGSSFGLRVRRHRLIETGGFVLPEPPACNHWWQDNLKIYPRNVDDKIGGRKIRWTGCMPVFGDSNNLKDGGDWFERSVAMGINWMNAGELAQAIPPAYTYWIGRHMMKAMN